MKYKLQVGFAILLLSLWGATQSRADELQPGVARISLIHGDVSTQRGDSGDWLAGTLNTPVVAGDHLSTGTRSRAELQLDYANILRLDERTEAKIADLARTRIQVQVRQGLVNYTVFKGNEADVEIDTPNVAVRPLGEAVVRILVLSDDESQVIVREGEAEVSTSQGSTRIRKNQLITIRGRDNPEYRTGDAPSRDDWDKWNRDRDHTIWNAESWNHTNRYYTGAGDLDRYGRWVYADGYDMVWMPAAGPGWAPYRDGRWVWEPYYGWTWVSYEPWGWAPYHYGRWFLYGGSWCWWPGPVYHAYYPVWAPAYVSFFGFGYSGRNFAIGFGFGSFGWLPIGPSDGFYPWWGAHRRTFNVVNVTNITNITNITNVRNITNVNGVQPMAPLATRARPMRSNLDGVLNDARLQRAVTTMPAEQFGRAAVPRNMQTVTAAQLRQGQVVAGNVPVVPTRESLRPVDRQVNPSTMPSRSGQPERFFTKSQPTYRPQPFQEQVAQTQQALEQHRAAMQTGRQMPAPRETQATPPIRTVTPPAPMRGNATTNVPAATAPSVPQRPATQAAPIAPPADRQGWQRFGRGEREPVQRIQEQPRTQPQAPPRATPQPAPQQRTPEAAPASSGWQRFPGRDRQQPQHNAPAERPAAQSPSRTIVPVPPPQQRTPETAPARPGWQQFRQQPQPQAQPQAQPRPAPQNQDRNYAPGRSEVQRPAPREWQGSVNREPPRSQARPPLELRRPIVTPRASGGNSGGGGYRGGRPSAPSSAPQGRPKGESNNERGSSRPPHR